VSGDANVRGPESLSELVDEACAFSMLGAASPDVRLTTHHDVPGLMVSIDKVQISQVIHNLIRNAFDAMTLVAAPVLRVTTTPADGGMVMVSIVDNGSGIDPEVAKRLFEPFVSTKGPQGMGVGLSICRTIIEAHQGQIWAASASTGVTAFHFTLPVALPEGEAR
jgi:two-component system sensor kinase FixL